METTSSQKIKKHIKCFKWEEMGHYTSECKNGGGKGDEANLTQKDDEETTLLLSACREQTSTLVLLNE